jgi:hypothetical protein
MHFLISTPKKFRKEKKSCPPYSLRSRVCLSSPRGTHDGSALASPW